MKKRGVVTTRPIPNAYGEFTQVLVDERAVGVYRTVDGGFLPVGKRKPRPTEREAQRDVIQSRIRSLLTETVPLMDALNEFVT